MNKETVLPLVRHLIQFGLGFAVAKGLATEGQATEITAGVLTVITALWFIIEKQIKAKAA